MNSTIKQNLTALFEQSLTSLNLINELNVPLTVQETNSSLHGDYQINLIMQLAKKVAKKPKDLAQEVISHIPPNELIQSCVVAGPGFINIKINEKYLLSFIEHSLNSIVYVNTPETVVVDYSSPNLAKEMHVGHLRSTIIGDSLVRIHAFIGNKVIRRNHVGDWGTQFGMLVAFILDENLYHNNSLSIKDLEVLYQQAKVRFDQDKDFANKAREYVVKLQSGDKLVNQIWKEFVAISLQHCHSLYKLLQVKLSIEDVYGESYYNSLLPQMIAILEKEKLLEISQGASCVFCDFNEHKSKSNTLENNSVDEINNTSQVFIVQKQDGGFLYATTDLATLYSRYHDLQADKILYVVDARQALHFKMLFDVAKRANIVSDKVVLEHVKFGVMCNTQGQPFKTRDGNTVKLIDLILEAKDRAKQMLQNKMIDSSINVDELAETLAISAIKYSDLSKNRTSDYIFDYDQMLSCEGNTAPYILYAFTRINSICQKVINDYHLSLSGNVINTIITTFKSNNMLVDHEVEREIILHIAKFPDVMLQVAQQNMPHFICLYVYKLATLFMRFYEHCPVIITNTTNENSDLTDLSKSRLKLLAIVSQIIEQSLAVLGINTVNKM